MCQLSTLAIIIVDIFMYNLYIIALNIIFMNKATASINLVLNILFISLENVITLIYDKLIEVVLDTAIYYINISEFI